MKIVKVTYTTRTEFSEQNQNNIKKVMLELDQLDLKGILYHVCISPDNKTFIHTAFFDNEDAEKKLLLLPSFKSFQEQLKGSSPEIPPKQELLNFVGSSPSVFK
jgi:hypothetical protein